jgi:hypothetical protein
MAACMVISYGSQVAQTNEEPPLESSLDLTLMQHPRDEELELQEVRTRLEVEPSRAWYYCISPNSRTLVILLQVDPAYGDELEIVCEGLRMVFNSRCWTLSLVAWFDLSTTS